MVSEGASEGRVRNQRGAEWEQQVCEGMRQSAAIGGVVWFEVRG